MHSKKYVEVKEFDTLGRPNMTGWSLPIGDLEELISLAPKDEK